MKNFIYCIKYIINKLQHRFFLMGTVASLLLMILFFCNFVNDSYTEREKIDTTPGKNESIEVGTKKQLFIDSRFVASSHGVTFRQIYPDLQRENLIQSEHSWERRLSNGSVMQYNGKVMLWYAHARNYFYAESKDGINFLKPKVGLFELGGSKENNMVMSGVCGSIFLDNLDSSDKRFKAVMHMDPDTYKSPPWSETEGAEPFCSYLFTSPDGINWKRSPHIVFPLNLGHQQSVIWDDFLQKWVLYLRAHRPHRCFGRAEVDAGKLGEPYPYRPLSGINYEFPGKVSLTEELPIVMDCDERDPPGGQPYTMNAWKYPYAEDAYFAFVPMWYDAREGNNNASDRVEVQLAISRDGVSWQRPWHSALISPGSPSLASSGQIWPLPEPIIQEGEIWLYYISMPCSHLGTRQLPHYLSDAEKLYYVDNRCEECVIARAVWRLDRLVAAESGPEGGFIITPPISFRGKNLILNADCGASGSLIVTIERPDGESIPGFTFDKAVPVQGNGIELQVRWNSPDNLSKLAEQPTRLRFYLRNCALYSFQFKE